MEHNFVRVVRFYHIYSLLHIIGRTTVAVRIGQVTKMVEFTVVKEMSPGVIAVLNFKNNLYLD